MLRRGLDRFTHLCLDGHRCVFLCHLGRDLGLKFCLFLRRRATEGEFLVERAHIGCLGNLAVRIDRLGNRFLQVEVTGII